MPEGCEKFLWGTTLPTIWKEEIEGKWAHMQPTSWCFVWKGKPAMNEPERVIIFSNLTKVRQENKNVHPQWNCSQIFDCNSMEKLVQVIAPIARALRLGCICKNFPSGMNDTWMGMTIGNKKFYCEHDSLPTMGHLVWVSEDGTWTSRLPLTDNTKRWTWEC